MLSLLIQYLQSTIGKLFQRYTQTFDVFGNILIHKMDNWSNKAWYPETMNFFTYDANGNMLTYLAELWNSGAWWKSDSDTYTYDAKGNLLSDINVYSMDGIIWYNYLKTTYTYDTNGNMLTKLLAQWNITWLNYRKDTFTNDTNGNRLSDLSQLWQDTIWVNDYQWIYTYDVNEYLISDLHKKWQSNVWVTIGRDIYTYDANGNLLIDLLQGLESTTWVNTILYTYTYDVNGNSITGKIEIWNNNKWQPGIDNLNIFSQKKLLIGKTSNIYRYQAHWLSFPVGITNFYNISNFEKVSIYPNPANDFVSIYVQEYSGKIKAVINLYSITGGLIKTLQIKNILTQLNISDLSKGVYIVKITNTNEEIVKKIIKE